MTEVAQLVNPQRGAFLHHSTMHSVIQPGHSYFKQDRQDLSNIPNHMKNMIIEQSNEKLLHYDAVKVMARSDLKYTAIDTKQYLAIKKKRAEVNYQIYMHICFLHVHKEGELK